jgi:hypothetical protein
MEIQDISIHIIDIYIDRYFMIHLLPCLLHGVVSISAKPQLLSAGPGCDARGAGGAQPGASDHSDI